ncbi:MAG: hypothetical protein HY331_17805 [Chloroflexi bacterium]|nr:hypothetical protein [Chloroflexota bacterium]
MAQWLSLEQLAAYLGVDEDRARALLHAARIRPPAPGRQVYLEDAQLAALDRAAKAAGEQ